MNDKEFLIEVAERLASVCDGARTEDGRGYNKYDAGFVRSILGDYQQYNNLSVGKWKALKKALIKYKGQIEDFGFEYSRIPKMKFTESVKHDEVEVEIKTNGDVELWVATPYNKEFIKDVKYQIDNHDRRFDWNTKTWVITVKPNTDSDEKVMGLIEEHFGVELDIEIPEVSFGTAKIDDGYAVLDTFYDKEFIEDVKSFSNRSFDTSTKCWSVKPTSLKEMDELFDLFDKWDIEYDSDVQIELDEIKDKLVQEEQEHQRMIELSNQKSLKSDYDVPLPDDDMELYPFQKFGVKMMDEREKVLLADEMGTGKTVQVLAHLYNKPEFRPVIVVCPSSVKINWKREIIKWTEAEEGDIQVLKGENGDIKANKLFYVINYSILPHRLDDLLNVGYEAVVFDESHYIKNHKAKRSKSALKLSEGTEHVYALSGTPMPNRPIELWTQLQVLRPDENDFKYLWGNNSDDGFAKKYCGARETRWGWDVNGASNLNELYNKLRQSIMVRRKKEDVLDELPDKRRIVLPLEIDNRNEYREAVMNFRRWMSKNQPGSKAWKNAEHLAKIEKLKQLAVEGKKEQMFKWLNDLVEQNGKIVIFAHHRKLQDELYSEFEDISVKITGGMKSDKRQDAIDEFTDGDAQLCIVSLIAGGEGINLQVANKVVFTEVNWTPKEHRQAEDRIHRIGQENRCDVYYLISDNTIEENIFNLINEKQKIIDQSIDGISEESKQGMLVDLVEQMTEEEK